jgi:hypothetical protein
VVCRTCSSTSCVAEDSSPIGCDTVFQRFRVPSSVGSSSPTTLCRILEDLNLHLVVCCQLPPPRLKGPACELKAPPPVAASFDTTASRSSAVTRSGVVAIISIQV